MLNTFYDKFIITNSIKYKNNNFYLLQMPFIITPIDIFTGMILNNDKNTNIELYESVKKSMKTEILKSFDKTFGINKEKKIKLIEDYFTASGWGKIEHLKIDLEKKQALIIVENSPFAIKLKGKTKNPVDHYLRGIIAGLMEEAFQEKVECIETECKAIGNSTCKFIVKRKNELNIDNPLIRKQIKIE